MLYARMRALHVSMGTVHRSVSQCVTDTHIHITLRTQIQARTHHTRPCYTEAGRFTCKLVLFYQTVRRHIPLEKKIFMYFSRIILCF